MAKKSKSEKPVPKPNDRPICENRRARFEYELLDTLECGIVLLGSEVKSLRNGKMSLEEAYGRIRDDEMWLIGCEIPEYRQATIWNHEPKRPRKLLLHRRELRKFGARAQEKGLTLVPLKVYFSPRGVVKVLMALCRGRKLHDKREVLKKRDTQRDIDRAMRRR
ncbi:MAG: SsrA-binding protein SmpB [Planctomycetes bacterium]|nr:SsrA-binding protein SmpB [Planctomycetota bacterium]